MPISTLNLLSSEAKNGIIENKQLSEWEERKRFSGITDIVTRWVVKACVSSSPS
jgi:hypothetical protein